MEGTVALGNHALLPLKIKKYYANNRKSSKTELWGGGEKRRAASVWE